MELRVLRYFLAVAREENMTEAAERLYNTQPTLSRQLMDLEEELGVRVHRCILQSLLLYQKRRPNRGGSRLCVGTGGCEQQAPVPGERI